MRAALRDVFSSDIDLSLDTDFDTNDKLSPTAFIHALPAFEELAPSDENGESTLLVGAESAENTARRQKDHVQSSFIAEQEWEGYVSHFDDKYFYAQLSDLTTPGIEEEAQFELDEISPIHRDLLKEGAIFRWSIGYERMMGGTRKRVSSIVFRRLPAWTKREIENSRKEAESLISGIQWN